MLGKIRYPNEVHDKIFHDIDFTFSIYGRSIYSK